MIIDWDCEEARGCDWVLVCVSNQIRFYKEKPNFLGNPIADRWTLHERPKAEQMKETIYTKEMHEAGELPKVGMKCSFFAGSKLGGGDFVEGTCLSVAKKSNGENVIMFEYTHNDSTPIDCTLFSDNWVKSIDKRTDKEKAIDDLANAINNYYDNDNKSFEEDAEELLNYIKAGKIHGITFTGDK